MEILVFGIALITFRYFAGENGLVISPFIFWTAAALILTIFLLKNLRTPKYFFRKIHTLTKSKNHYGIITDLYPSGNPEKETAAIRIAHENGLTEAISKNVPVEWQYRTGDYVVLKITDSDVYVGSVVPSQNVPTRIKDILQNQYEKNRGNEND